MAEWSQPAQLYIETCYQCKTRFGMSQTVHDAAVERREKMTFSCPNGHQQHYTTGENEETKLRRERDWLKQNTAYLEQRIRDEQAEAEAQKRQAAAYKGVATRIKNRVKQGVCPCCNRTFANLAAHVKTKHPDFDNVVSLEMKA